MTDTPLLVVYTAIFGQSLDRLRPPGLVADPHGRRVEFHAFTNRPDLVAFPWRVWQFSGQYDPTVSQGPRRAARKIKTDPRLCQSHKADYTLWLDGSHRLTANPWDMVDRHLQDADVAIARHSDRNCVYQELQACLRMRKDDPKTMQAQIDRYRAAGYPEHNGLHETGAVLRRITPASDGFSLVWGREIRTGSCRDQLSVDYAAWYRGIKISTLPGSGRSSPYFEFFPHR